MANIKAPGAPEPGTFLFTSESVNEGHPDKICDQVSDAVLDACLKEDERSRVACETCTKTGMVMIFGEISTNANVNYEQVIRDALKDIGYDDTAKGLDYKTCNVVVAVEEQSPDIAQSVDAQRIEDIGAGDQGIMFGYATDETDSLMPLSHELATQIGARLTEVRKKGICEWCRPDGKTQVSWTYANRVQQVKIAQIQHKTQHRTDQKLQGGFEPCCTKESIPGVWSQASDTSLLRAVCPCHVLTVTLLCIALIC